MKPVYINYLVSGQCSFKYNTEYRTGSKLQHETQILLKDLPKSNVFMHRTRSYLLREVRGRRHTCFFKSAGSGEAENCLETMRSSTEEGGFLILGLLGHLLRNSSLLIHTNEDRIYCREGKRLRKEVTEFLLHNLDPGNQ